MIDDLKLNLAKLKDYDDFASSLISGKTGKKAEIDPWYYIHWSPISPEVIALSLEMIFPEFIEYDGCVFLKTKFSEATYKFCIEKYNGNKEDYERFINTVELLYLFDDKYTSWDGSENYSYSIDFLGKVFEKNWKRELEEKFKDRKFHVEYYEDHNYGPIIYFHTIRD